VLMSVEHAPQDRRGLFGSFVALGLPSGIILSNLVFLITSVAVSPAAFAAWAWRVPFLASALLVMVGLYVRLGIAESPIFADVQRRQAESRMPIVDVMRGHARTVLLAAGSYMSISAFGYVTIVFFVSYATRQLRLPLTATLELMVTAAIVFAMSLVFCARWSDRVGRRSVMKFGLAALGVWSLVFFPLADTRSLPLIALSLCGMLFIQGLYVGPQPAVFSELFPTTVRYSGASLSLTLGTILGGALAPMIATSLYGLTGTSWPITAYLAAMSIISWLCVRALDETSRMNLAREQ
jgi:MFS family permease